MFRVIVAGSRGFNDYERLRDVLDKLLASKLPDVQVVSGAARGADQLGERYASEKGLGVNRMPADWDTHGRRAGYVRNEQMAEVADALVAFWDGESRGTKHMIDIATAKGMMVRVVRV